MFHDVPYIDVPSDEGAPWPPKGQETPRIQKKKVVMALGALREFEPGCPFSAGVPQGRRLEW